MCLQPLPEVLKTPENSSGGILVVCMPGLGPVKKPLRKGNFFDNSIDRGCVVERFIEWFPLWGIKPMRMRGREGAFERQFFTLQWPQRPVEDAHGPQMVPLIAEKIEELAAVLERRRPRIIIFLSRYLWLAANTSQARARLSGILGKPLDEGRRITGERLNACAQSWENCLMLALPQPSKNTTDKFVQSLAAGMRAALSRASCPLLAEQSTDPLLSAARECLVLDREASIRRIAAELHVEKTRAQALFDSLKDRAWTEKDGRPTLMKSLRS